MTSGSRAVALMDAIALVSGRANLDRLHKKGRANPAFSVSNPYAAASFLFVILAITTKPTHASTMVTANGIQGLPMMPARI